MNLTKKSSNQEIQEAFGQLLATGEPFIFAVDDTANAEYKTLCIAQEIETPGSATEEQALFLGWGNNKTIVRVLQNAKVDQFKVLEQKWGAVAPGTVLKGTGIRIDESNTPQSWLDANGQRVYQEPKVYPASSKFAGKKMVTEDGKPIYRNTSLALSAKPTHTFLKGIPEGTENVAAEVKATFDELVNV